MRCIGLSYGSIGDELIGLESQDNDYENAYTIINLFQLVKIAVSYIDKAKLSVSCTLHSWYEYHDAPSHIAGEAPLALNE